MKTFDEILRRSIGPTKGSGEADRLFRDDPPKCECGKKYVHKKGVLCIDCRRAAKKKKGKGSNINNGK